MICALCRKSIVGEEVKAKDGSAKVACRECYDAMIEALAAKRTVPPECECGHGGCDCPENLRAITRGEAAKAREEEGHERRRDEHEQTTPDET